MTEDSELKIMYRHYNRQKAALDKLWGNILAELVRQVKEVNIDME